MRFARAVTWLETAAWSVAHGEERSKGQTGKLSSLVFQVIWYLVALTLFVHCEWMVLKLKYIFLRKENS